MNQFGHNFRLAIWGESHGHQIGISLDGVPAGIPLSEEDFAEDLARRRSGAPGTTPRREPDVPQIVSGVYDGYTTGAPLTIEFANTNTHSQDYSTVMRHYRPSHADLVPTTNSPDSTIRAAADTSRRASRWRWWPRASWPKRCCPQASASRPG